MHVLTDTTAAQHIAQLEAELTASRERVAALERERDLLRQAHEQLWLELQLLKRRIFMAKAERVDTTQLEMEFAEKMAALEKAAETLGMGPAKSAAPDATTADGDGKKGSRSKPKGRRDLFDLCLPETRIELGDAALDALVVEGKADVIGFEVSAKLGWQRSGVTRVVMARKKYRLRNAEGEATVETATIPPETISRCMAAPSMLAHVAVEKFCDGLPLARIEDRLGRDGVPVDRGTMSRWMEDLGATLGATIIEAMRVDALANAFVIATDATGIAVQPGRRPERKRQECRRGHFLVQVADDDHVLFEYMASETSAAIKERFATYASYVQADAKSVFDALFLGPKPKEPKAENDDLTRLVALPSEVGCWSHARRKFWEASLARSEVAREALHRIGRVFELDATWRDKPPNEIRALRNKHVRPHLEAFFAWAEAEYERVRDQRGLSGLRSVMLCGRSLR